jgi:hypothetical protein
MNDEHRCSTAFCGRKCTSYNIHVKLYVHCKKRGEHGIGIACTVQILDMMVRTASILKSAQEIVTKPVNLQLIVYHQCNTHYFVLHQ